MGNRANVVFVNKAGDNISPTVYLHWNGGAESIYAFLDELDRRKVRADQCYECARFVQIVSEFFDSGEERYGTLSLGVMNGPKTIDKEGIADVPTDIGDNGFFVVCREGERTVRRFVTQYSKDHKVKIVEMSEKDVEAERVEAYQHEYHTGSQPIANTFLNNSHGRKVPESVM